ncbi:hypothetical protein [Rhizocola hellebori]|uniref:hypothetical protein n=1 Tax=Rhizocola hellebori TaxID=1392758 RepID=UPI001943FEA9|nr:hypothetical protein [Rhizocola hellebori]
MDDAKKGSSWSSTIAMITAAGTLLAALVALASFLVGQQFFGDTPAGRNPDGQPADGPAVTDTQGKRLNEEVLWPPSKMLLASSMDFDGSQGPIRDSEYPDTDVYQWFTDDAISSPHCMVKWTGAGVPGQNDCATLLATHGVSDHLSYEAGDRFCFRTSKARIAMFEVLGPTDTGVEVRATTWKQRL